MLALRLGQLVVAMGISGCFAPLVFGQGELARKDEAAILYSNRLQFSSDNQPMVPVGLMDDQDQIRFASPRGLVFLPSGPDGPRVQVAGSGDWQATVVESTPGVVSWGVVLERIPTREFARLKERRAYWQDRVGQVELRDSGVVFGFYGKVLDTRETLILAGEKSRDKAAARSLANRLTRDFGGDGVLLEILEERPRGTIQIQGPGGDVKFTARDAIWFEAPDQDKLTIRSLEFGRGFKWHGREDRAYVGSFYVVVDRRGKLAVANVLPAERLLEGLVPAEMYVSAAAEALKAQAVTARGELLSKIGHRHQADPYLICSEQDCQVYKGVSAEDRRTSAAVEQTRGKMLFYKERLADARYHSTCGGHTENSEVAWPGVDSEELRGRPDADGRSFPDLTTDAGAREFLSKQPGSWCGASGKSGSTLRWNVELPARDLDKLVAGKHQVGHVVALNPLNRGVSGRINKLEIRGDRATVTVGGELEIRRLLGGLKSSAFVVQAPGPGETVWRLRGGGFGHGVGMCQNGAMGMAAAGKTYIQILLHYYKDTSVEQIY